MTEHSARRYAVAVNPAASFGGGKAVGPMLVEVLRADGHTVTMLQADSYVRLEEAVRAALAEQPDALIVVGGDGMVHLGINHVAGTSIPLAVMPSGTGNDMARGLGMPVGDPAAAIESLRAALAAPPVASDVLRIENAEGVRYAAGVLSAGFDALVNERANLMRWPKGRQRYNLAIARELAALKPREYRLVVDGVERTERAILIAVANNTSFGGGMQIVPQADMTDGVVELFLVRPLSRTKFLAVFPKVFKGEHVGHPAVHIEPVRHVTIAADPTLAGYADGERVGLLPTTVSVMRGAALIHRPPVTTN